MFHFGTCHQPPQPRTAGRLRVVPLFSLAWRKRSGRGRKRTEEDGEDGNGNLRRTEDSERMGEDFERMEEDGEEETGH